MAGKSWQPSLEPTHGREKQEPITLKNQWTERERKGGPPTCMGRAPTLKKMLTLTKTHTKMHALGPKNTWKPAASIYYIYTPLMIKSHWYLLLLTLSNCTKLHLTLKHWHQVASLPLDSPGLTWPIYMYTNNATEILANAYPQLIRNIII